MKGGTQDMPGFIEQFHYGNIEPQARGISTNKTMAKELGVLNDAEEYLTSKLSGEEKKKFLNFVNATSVVNGETALDSFIVGFRLGAAVTLDTVVSNDTPFTNLLNEAYQTYIHLHLLFFQLQKYYLN